jgi:hypothetical protein
MSKVPLEQDLRNFVEFATKQIEQGETAESLEALVRLWRDRSEYEETVEDVRQGLTEDTQSLSEPIAAVFSDIRNRLGIAV